MDDAGHTVATDPFLAESVSAKDPPTLQDPTVELTETGSFASTELQFSVEQHAFVPLKILQLDAHDNQIYCFPKCFPLSF